MNPESLILNDAASSRDDMEIDEDVTREEESKYCLNCGAEISGNYCSNCGQLTSVPRKMNNRMFGKSVLICFSRLSSTFFHTFVSLMFKPWEVIRNFIHGRHVSYSHPITMLIQLTLVTTFIITTVEGLFDISLFQQTEYEGSWIVKALKSSVVIRICWYAVPFIIAGYLAYWKFGSRRFTFSEYLIAALYLVITIRIYFLFISPINYLWFGGDTTSDLTIVVVPLLGIIFGGITIFKAFPIKSKWKSAFMFIFFLALSFGLMVLYTTCYNFIDDVLMGKDLDNWLIDYFE